MYFKRLEIFGFKSFAAKTTIEFDAGVTAIVGPNGCGKSNIADSIRWVLGEQSAKSLRGSHMEDVIFNGSSSREPLNLAEVSLTLSNETRLLPIDYEEVTITRRLYRSGDSEYLLNKNVVRLRDIHELLMGTGIGTESYSIIEQGKIDMILNAKPEDRREIFEEAAGITKYKAKKKEALSKLESTDANLLRVNDIIQEVKRQIGSIERQAKKAESYKKEFEKLKNLELAVASREFFIFENEHRVKGEALEKLKNEERDFQSSFQLLERNRSEEKSAFLEIENDLKIAEAEELGLKTQIQQSQDRTLLNRERIGELAERKENIFKQIQDGEQRLEEFSKEAQRLQSEFEVLEKEDSGELEPLQIAETDFKLKEDLVRHRLGDETSAKSRLLDIANERAHQQSELAKIHAQAAALASRLKRLAQEEESHLQEIRVLEEKNGATLFAQSEDFDGFGQKLKAVVQEFKQKVVSLLRRLVEMGKPEPGPEEESALDLEIKNFTEAVAKTQEKFVERRSLSISQDETRKKSEEKLSVIAIEKSDLWSEEKNLSQREAVLESELLILSEEEKSLLANLLEIQAALQSALTQRDNFLVQLTQIRSKQGHASAIREKAQKDRSWIEQSRLSQADQLSAYKTEMEGLSGKKETLQNENQNLEAKISGLLLERDETLRRAESTRLKSKQQWARVQEAEKALDEKQVFLISLREQTHALELESAQVRFEIDRLKDRILNAYQVDLLVQSQIAQTEEAVENLLNNNLEAGLETARAEIEAQKQKLSRMGPVNLVAIEEYDEMKQRYDFLSQQESDLVHAKEDLHQAILKINRTTKELFIETFSKLQKHFSDYTRLLFNGGSAELVLLDENDVLESGIEIVVRPPGKKIQNLSLLSGGEKALTAVALLFALFRVKPSPFCILDEIDAPLDETNVERFCNILKEFISESQFILITHNKRTMNLTNAMYGITMADSGVSQVVSVRFAGQKLESEQAALV